MRVAWFHAAVFVASETAEARAALFANLAGAVQIDVITEAGAHDFVVEHALRPYDVCVYQIRNGAENDFIWAYLFQYPGVLVLDDWSLHDSRVRALERSRRSREYAAEFAFNHGHPSRGTARPFARGGWPMLRAPLYASRLVVVSDEARRRELEDTHPGIEVRTIAPWAATPPESAARHDNPPHSSQPLRIASRNATSRHVVERAVRRAADAGAGMTLLPVDATDADVARADILLALTPPSAAADLTTTLSAMARGQAVIVLEREATATWPAIDPQTWRGRDVFDNPEPVVVSVDPRDEEHSLTLALKGLAIDHARRRALGIAARRWWQVHATPAIAAAAWLSVLQNARLLARPERPANWPAHLDVDGTELAQKLLLEMGVPGVG